MTTLDRENWSWSRCPWCGNRRCQLTIDKTPRLTYGTYIIACWECYWSRELWRQGPIINCGPMWDGVDVRRDQSK